jgi:predicted ABC-class ATPase
VCGISTVLVMGGSGDYFDVADTVIAMRGYEAREATAEARAVAEQHPSARSRDALSRLARPAPRVPLREGFRAARGRRDVSLRARGIHELLYGEESVDLRGLEQLVDTSQTRAVGAAIHWAAQELCDGERTLAELLDGIEELLDRRGLDPLDPFYRPGQHPGNFARPRRFEIAAAINRLRSLRILSQRAAPELT